MNLPIALTVIVTSLLVIINSVKINTKAISLKHNSASISETSITDGKSWFVSLLSLWVFKDARSVANCSITNTGFHITCIFVGIAFRDFTEQCDFIGEYILELLT